jgi:hypothetical protein
VRDIKVDQLDGVLRLLENDVKAAEAEEWWIIVHMSDLLSTAHKESILSACVGSHACVCVFCSCFCVSICVSVCAVCVMTT